MQFSETNYKDFAWEVSNIVHYQLNGGVLLRCHLLKDFIGLGILKKSYLNFLSYRALLGGSIIHRVFQRMIYCTRRVVKVEG